MLANRLPTSDATTRRRGVVNVNNSSSRVPFLNAMLHFTYSCRISLQRFLQEGELHGQNMASDELGTLDVFRSTVEVMLSDGVLTREEKRLIIKLASALKLSPEEPAYIYQAIQSNAPSTSGVIISQSEMRSIYTKVFEVAIVNASLSKDEFRVLAHLRGQFNINNEMHESIEKELKELVREKYEDKDVIDTLLHTLRDSVGLVGDMFDSFRKKTNEGGTR